MLYLERAEKDLKSQLNSLGGGLIKALCTMRVRRERKVVTPSFFYSPIESHPDAGIGDMV